jgi:hypothetical protein
LESPGIALKKEGKAKIKATHHVLIELAIAALNARDR